MLMRIAGGYQGRGEYKAGRKARDTYTAGYEYDVKAGNNNKK